MMMVVVILDDDDGGGGGGFGRPEINQRGGWEGLCLLVEVEFDIVEVCRYWSSLCDASSWYNGVI